MVDFTALSALTTNQPQTTITRNSADLQTAIASLISDATLNQSQSDDVASLSLATQLQASNSGLKQVSGGLAQASSLTQVAASGASQIKDILNQLNALAKQAQGASVTDSQRQTLDQQFQALVSKIGDVVKNTTFNNQPLLDGSVSGSNQLSLASIFGVASNPTDHTLSIQSLASSDLFGGQSLNLLSTDSAKQAADVIGDALGKVTGIASDIGAFQQTVDLASAGIDTAMTNEDAAQALLGDNDLDSSDSTGLVSLLTSQENASLALSAQTNRLSPGVLKLLG